MIFESPVGKPIALTSNGTRWFRSQPFGCTGVAYEPPLGNCGHYHRAIDVARGAAGDPLYAMAAGKVIYSGPLNDGNQVVVMYHGQGFATGHSHMKSRSVSQGQQLAKGAKVGTCGSSGLATGPHDHVAVKGGFPGNPMGVNAANAFWQDNVGRWIDPWPLLSQNVTLHVKPLDAIRIRTEPKLGDAYIYAETQGGRIIRNGTDLGAANLERDWGGTVLGAGYPKPTGGNGRTWERMLLGGAYRCVASPYAALSAR